MYHFIVSDINSHMAVSTVVENQISRFPILNGNLNWLFVAFYPIMLCPGGSRNMDPEMAHDQHGKTGTEKCSWESAKDSQTATRIIFCSAP